MPAKHGRGEEHIRGDGSILLDCVCGESFPGVLGRTPIEYRVHIDTERTVGALRGAANSLRAITSAYRRGTRVEINRAALQDAHNYYLAAYRAYEALGPPS